MGVYFYDAFLGVTLNPPFFLVEAKFWFIPPGPVFPKLFAGPAGLDTIPDVGLFFFTFFLVDLAFPIFFFFGS
jgi:hypothetical protein